MTVALIGAAALAWLLSLLRGGAPIALLDLLALILFGRGVEASLGGARLLALAAAGGLLSYGAQRLAGGSAAGAATLAASGAVAAILGAYLALHPRAKVLSVAFVPVFASVVAVPAALLIAGWLALQAVLGATGAAEPLGGSGAWLAHLALLPVGALLARPLRDASRGPSSRGPSSRGPSSPRPGRKA